MPTWKLLAAALALSGLGGAAPARADEDQPPGWWWGHREDDWSRARPEERDEPQDQDRVDTRDQQDRLEYEDALARCGRSWMCRRHVRRDYAERRRFRY